MQKIDQLRKGRSQQMETQQMIEAAPAASNVLKTMMPKQPVGTA
jgi:hypothetical protein